MSGLLIDAELCIGCKRCMRACATAGIEVVDRLARQTDGCVLCGACVDACPVGAISIDAGQDTDAAELASYRGIYVFAQTDAQGSLLPVALELVGKARELAAQRGCCVTALLAEAETARAHTLSELAVDNAATLIACGADAVIRARVPGAPDAEQYARWLVDVVHADHPEILLIGATAFGRVLAPMVAVRLETGLTADCTLLEIDPETGLLQQTRPAIGGNLMATIMCPLRRPQMATVRPGVFAAPEPDAARTGEVIETSLPDECKPGLKVLSCEAASSGDSITQADALGVIGRGIGSKKQVPLMQRLADLLGAKLGCTRPLVEAGWLEYAHQVGQTGASVAPKFLLSIGVSGAIQHLAGIGGAQTIVAINDDPAAPIFDVASYRVVGDCIEIVEQMVAQLEQRSGKDALKA